MWMFYTVFQDAQRPQRAASFLKDYACLMPFSFKVHVQGNRNRFYLLMEKESTNLESSFVVHGS